MSTDNDRDYPTMSAHAGLVEPAPRRVRGVVAGQTVFDTCEARYVWEAPYYPQYYIRLTDIAADVLVDEGRTHHLNLGPARAHGLSVGAETRPGTVRVYSPDAHPDVAETARFGWAALDAWYEEDEQIFVHPRNPYVRVDALRSHRTVTVELDGVLLARTSSPVLLLETGLPTRYYVDRTDVCFEHLVASHTETACPYKGITSDHWSVHSAHEAHADVAWSYNFPLRGVAPIAGLVAFYNEHVDITVDGRIVPRPATR